MTITDETAGRPTNERSDWAGIAVGLAQHLARPSFPRGDLAALRRMSPPATDVPAFWRLAAQYDLLGAAVVERKWALIMHGIALMTPTAEGRTAHDPKRSVGAALYLGGEPFRTAAFYSETRLNRLLTARGPTFQTLLTRMFRMLASADVSFDWREMAWFILLHGHDEQKAEQTRRRIARAYYQRTSAGPSC
jgi:CRISPR system Cascade subunit CasB